MVYYCVLDFEATCWENMEGKKHEIIEFPSILWYYDGKSLEHVGDFREFVKPKKCPILSAFCTKLTGITQEQVNNGISFEEALNKHIKWIYSNLTNGLDVYIVTVGDCDLKDFLFNECKIREIKAPSIYKRWINIKNEFKKFYNYDKGLGLMTMLKKCELEIEGRLHSGFDDCHNTSRVLIKMIEDGFNPVESKINVL